MKFCKDCKYFEPSNVDNGAKFAFGPYCRAKNGPAVFDPVTGRELGGRNDPTAARNDPNLCGMDAKWFEPATLDGRLAMLDDSDHQPKEIA